MTNTSIRIPDKLHEELRECVYQHRLQSSNSVILEGLKMVLNRYSERKEEKSRKP